MADVIKFEKNKEFLSGDAAAGLELTAVKDPGVAAALAANLPFPAGDVRLGDIAVSGEAGRSVKFAGDRGSVEFKASGEARAGLGVYFDPGQLLGALDLDDDIAPGMSLKSDPNSLYLVLSWGYDLAGSAKGSLALGANPLTISFGAEGKRAGSYAVVRRFAREKGARDAVAETANSWMLPTQVESLDKFEPGTWLVAEVDGSIALSLGAKFGYDYNWVRETQLGGLSGAIGLRIQLGVSVALGFEASGKYALVVGRESQDPADRRLRLRLFRQRKRGWSFAFNAAATVQGKNELLPGELDDFIAGVFGTHGAQIVKDLEVLDKWTDVTKDPAELLAGFSIDYARKFLGSVTAIKELNIPENLERAKSLVLDLIDKWNDLDHRVATMLLKLAERGGDLARVRELVGKIAGADDESIRAEVAGLLKGVDFFDTPEGKWLESVAAGALLPLLTDSREFGRLKEAAAKTKALLDGGALEETLGRLQEYINRKLHLSEVEKVVREADLDQLDEWLKARLTKFLGEEVDFTRVKELQKAISTVRDKGQEFYRAGLKALTDKYTFEFAATYQKTTTRTALFDIDFDFAAQGVGASLREAIDGKFDGLLVEERPGVTLNAAELTHGVKRQTHVELTLPFFGKSEMDHFNNSLARVKATNDNGRVLAYELDAEDIVVKKNQRNSTVTLAGFFPLRPGDDVQVFSTSALDYGYSLRQVKRGMKRADLDYQLASYMDPAAGSGRPLLGGVFGPQADGTVAASFDAWLGDLDVAVEHVLRNGPDTFGDALLSLEVGVSPNVTAAWLNAPADETSPLYLDMSRRIQAKLKELVPFIYFQNPERYDENKFAAASLLVYSAIPRSTQIRLANGKLEINQRTGIYWDHLDPDKFNAMVNNGLTAGNLGAILQRVFDRLRKTAGFEKLADEYRPTPNNIDAIRNRARKDPADALHKLLRIESMTVRGAREAGINMAGFKRTGATEPAKALKFLANFGEKFTDAFNVELSGLHNGFKSRAFGTLLLVESALALNPGLSAADVKTSAILELIVLTEGAKFNPAAYLEGTRPPKEEIVVQQRFVSV